MRLFLRGIVGGEALRCLAPHLDRLFTEPIGPAALAQAAQVGIYVNAGYAPDNSGCWRWSHRFHRWCYICGYDQPGYYQQPYYYGPSPFLGFGFSFGDHDRGRHFDRGGDKGHRWDHDH